jgi:hypothetical protein
MAGQFVSMYEKPTLREILSHTPQQEQDFCYRTGAPKLQTARPGKFAAIDQTDSARQESESLIQYVSKMRNSPMVELSEG